MISVPAKISADLTSGLKRCEYRQLQKYSLEEAVECMEGKAGNKEKSEIKKSQG